MLRESRKQIREIKHLINNFKSKPEDLQSVIYNFYDIRAVIEQKSYQLEGIKDKKFFLFLFGLSDKMDYRASKFKKKQDDLDLV